MHRKRFFWHILPSYLLIGLVGVVAIAWLAFHSFRDTYVEQIRQSLRSQAQLVREQFGPGISNPDPGKLAQLCRKLARETGARITVIDSSGVVLCDSDREPELMDNHANRPEFLAAMSQGFGTSTRYSYSLQKRMIYAALPMEQDGKAFGVVRTALPVSKITRTLATMFGQIAGGAIAITLLAAGLSIFVSRRIT
jgi:two-component system phosphate regulon sensor histidine kinase PhoR